MPSPRAWGRRRRRDMVSMLVGTDLGGRVREGCVWLGMVLL
jgi:hypothetical protein